MKVVAVLAMFIISSDVAFTQGTKERPYTIEASMSMSPVWSSFANERYPNGDTGTAWGYGAFARIQWHPGKLLSFGVLTGFVKLASDKIQMENEMAEAVLTAVPLQVLVTMQKNNLEAGLGMGPYLLMSALNSSNSAHGNRIELGITLFLAYTFPISANASIGPELRVLYLDYRGIFSVMPSITMSSTLFAY